MFLKNWPYKYIFQNSDHKKVLAKTVLPRNTCEIKNDNKFNNFQLFWKLIGLLNIIRSDGEGILHGKITA